MRYFNLIITLFLITFTVPAFADIVHFDNSNCTRALLSTATYNYYNTWQVRGGGVNPRGQTEINTGDHVKQGEEFRAGFDGLLGNYCTFTGTGGHHFVRTETGLVKCILAKCESY